MGKRHRRRPPARRATFREPKPLILVVSEGKVTEPEYLHGFARACRNPRVEIEVFGGQGAPRTLVEFARDRKKERVKQARREKDDNLRYDEVWCVFDVDEHRNRPAAEQMARDNGLRLAVSNPCIELWLWLHFAEQPGMQDRHRLLAMLKSNHLPEYDKHVDFRDYATGYDTAVQRASQLDEQAERDGEAGRNPTTGFWRLTESISQES